MNIYPDELIGFESMLPTEIIILLNTCKIKRNELSIDEKLNTTNAIFLDAHELAMAA